MKHIVMFSGGIGSWACAKRVAEEHGAENTTLLFADVKGASTNPHIGEDEDTYRFLRDASANVGSELVMLNQGETIWDVFKRRRFLGNSRQANCSTELKQKPCRAWLEEHCPPEGTVVYVGIDWTESHRLPAIEKAYLPYVAKAPLTEPPYIDKEDMIKWAESENLDPPRLYAAGYPHNNCGGGCVRAGKGQFQMLLRQNPERYRVWEENEKDVQDYLGTKSTILRETRKGVRYNLTLTELRERTEAQPLLLIDDDIGGCGCFTDYEGEPA
jgi:hypothetical protein